MLKLKKSKLQIYINNFLLILSGFIVFSPISSYISQNILNLTLSLPELLFVPFYFKFRRLFNLKINFKTFIIGAFFILFLVVIALIVGQYPLTSILSTARGYTYMLLAFSIFKNKQISNINYIFFIALGSSIGWMILGLASLNQLIYNLNPQNISLAVYGNMLALALSIIISIVYKKKILFFIVLGTTLIISLTAGLRRQIAIALVSYILSFFTQIKFKFKRIISISISLVFISVLIINLLPQAKSFTAEISPTLYVRIFVKTEQLISGDVSTSDQTRLNSLDRFTDDLESYILPRGLVSKRTMQDAGTGLFMDSPYIELFHTFGLFFSIPIIWYFFSSVLFHYKNYYKNHINESAVWFTMGGVIFVLMLIEGSFLNFVYTTPITGFVLARLASRKNLTP